MDKIYENYHKHSYKSNVFGVDSFTHVEDYFKRAKELGHTRYYTTEHAYGGSVFEALKYQKKYDIKVVDAMEIYVVLDSREKDRSNYHMIIIAKNNKGRREMNLQNSIANEFGFYYKPRWSLDQILNLNPDNFWITTACGFGIAETVESTEGIAIPILSHFGKDNFFWEVQSHNEESQIAHNKHIIECSVKYGGRLIHANDSHYIDESDKDKRYEFLSGKGINYGNEDSYILDYPTYDTIIERYERQGILSKEQIKESLANTLIVDSEEYIDISDNIKMPTLYPNLSPTQRYNKLAKLVSERWKEIRKEISPDRYDEYKEAIKFEMNIIKETNDVVHTADYFLLDEKIVSLAKSKYGGVLTKSGRGSGCSFVTNYLLGLTDIDRLDVSVPMFPTRFMSKSRLLETRSLPDIDMNLKDPEPFMKASIELLGEHQCYWMLAYGTLQDSGAFKNYCRYLDDNNRLGFKFSEVNRVSQDLDNYRNHSHWGKIIKESQYQIGAVDSMSRSPGSAIIMNDDVREEIGLIRSGNDMCAVITSAEVEDWKYLKNDYLTVTVVTIIDNVYREIGIKQHSVRELLKIAETDENMWNLYRDGITETLNQTATENGRRQVMIYKPKNYLEISSFVASIRPSFGSLVDKFLHRKHHTTGIPALDNILSESGNYILYQESVMKFLVWLGVEEDKTYGIVKNISKKKYLLPEYAHEIEELHELLTKNWIKKTGSIEGFQESWQVVEDSVAYSFNASHSFATGVDSMYGAYLKANYPMAYYKTVFNMFESNKTLTTSLTKELGYFGIKLISPKYGFSQRHYTSDLENATIYKGIVSIATFGDREVTAIEYLNSLSNTMDNNFINLLDVIYQRANRSSLEDFKNSRNSEYKEFKDELKARLLEESHVPKKYDKDKFKILSKQYKNGMDANIKEYIKSECPINNTIGVGYIIKLIKLGFFREFGGSKYLIEMLHLYDLIRYTKVMNKKSMEKLPIEWIRVISENGNETDAQYNQLDSFAIMESISNTFDKTDDLPIDNILITQSELLGYIDGTTVTIQNKANYCMVLRINLNFTPFLTLQTLTGKTFNVKINKGLFSHAIKEGSIIEIQRVMKKPQSKYLGDDEDGKPKYEIDKSKPLMIWVTKYRVLKPMKQEIGWLDVIKEE